MNTFINRFRNTVGASRCGMELVQVAMLIAIAVTLGLLFTTQITEFVNNVFKSLNSAQF